MGVLSPALTSVFGGTNDALRTRLWALLRTGRGHTVLRNGPNRSAKRPISEAKTAHFAVRNGPFCNVLIINALQRQNKVARHGVLFREHAVYGLSAPSLWTLKLEYLCYGGGYVVLYHHIADDVAVLYALAADDERCLHLQQRHTAVSAAYASVVG